jgi:hypothetical protein
MAESKKSTPESSDSFGHGADGSPKDYEPTYYGTATLPKYSPSYSVYHDKTEAATSGVRPQAEGRKGLPPASAVTEAKPEEGTTLRCVKRQTGLNRYAINTHVAEKKEFGANN